MWFLIQIKTFLLFHANNPSDLVSLDSCRGRSTIDYARYAFADACYGIEHHHEEESLMGHCMDGPDEDSKVSCSRVTITPRRPTFVGHVPHLDDGLANKSDMPSVDAVEEKMQVCVGRAR